MLSVLTPFTYQQSALAFGARDTEGVLGAVEYLADRLGTEKPSVAMAHQLPLFPHFASGGPLKTPTLV